MKIPPVKGDTFAQLFELQRSLLKYYTQIEGLPKFPVNLLEKGNQKFIRELISRITTELCEAYGSLIRIHNACDENLSEVVVQEALKEYNLEMADVWHFFIELMLFAGEDEYSVEAHNQSTVISNPELQGIITPGDSFESLWRLSVFFANQEGLGYPIPNTNGFSAISEQIAADNPHLRGGRKISVALLEIHSTLLFQIIFILSEAGNFLKIKDWSQGAPESNVLAFKEGLYEALMTLMKYSYLSGQTELGVFHAYYIKNQMNLKRIKDGY